VLNYGIYLDSLIDSLFKGSLEVVGDIKSSGVSLSKVSNSLSEERQGLTLLVVGTSVFLDVQAVGGGDITYNINGVERVLDCTTGDGVDGKARVEIAQGTAIKDLFSVVYVSYSEQLDKLVLVNSIGLPVDSYANVAYLSIQDYASVTANGPIVFQRTSDTPVINGQGSISRISERARLTRTSGWYSGVYPAFSITAYGGSEDDINAEFTVGQIYQQNRQSFPAIKISTDGIFMSGLDSAATLDNLEKITNLNQVHETRLGSALADGESMVMYIYGNINYSEGDCKLFCVPSDTKHSTDADTIQEAKYAREPQLPSQHRTVAFYIGAIVLKYNTADNGTWTNLLAGSVSTWHTGYRTWTTPNYPSNYDNNLHEYLTSTITEPGATAIRIVFQDFITEANYDYIRLRNAGGTNIFSYHGNLGAFTSANLIGDTVRVYADFDSSVTRKGVKSIKYEYQKITPTGAGFLDLR